MTDSNFCPSSTSSTPVVLTTTVRDLEYKAYHLSNTSICLTSGQKKVPRLKQTTLTIWPLKPRSTLKSLSRPLHPRYLCRNLVPRRHFSSSQPLEYFLQTEKPQPLPCVLTALSWTMDNTPTTTDYLGVHSSLFEVCLTTAVLYSWHMAPHPITAHCLMFQTFESNLGHASRRWYLQTRVD